LVLPVATVRALNQAGRAAIDPDVGVDPLTSSWLISAISAWCFVSARLCHVWRHESIGYVEAHPTWRTLVSNSDLHSYATAPHSCSDNAYLRRAVPVRAVEHNPGRQWVVRTEISRRCNLEEPAHFVVDGKTYPYRVTDREPDRRLQKTSSR
jgi:hypothetical protein